MQRGLMQRICRKRGPDVWQFRWSETGADGIRTHHKKVVGTVEQFTDEHSARRAVVGLITEINADPGIANSRVITIAELCDHFEQRELAEQNAWRSHATKKIYKAYLNRWVRPHWRRHTLAEVRTIQVESWLRTLPLAKSSCAKIRNLMSVLFNHACRYELFDRNPIYLVRQSAKRRRVPVVLLPADIKALVNCLGLRERTLVLVAASTGLRHSEIFGLKWGDIDFAQRAMSVTRSIVYGVVGPCKTESSQKPVPLHSAVAQALLDWKRHSVRVGDPRLISLIRRWLKANVLEDEERHANEEGTAQGGSISVLLSNLYLHCVLYLWFERVVKPRLRGEAYLVRYIDDFVLCFQYREDALRVQDALRERLGKFGLTLEPKKTKLVEFGRFAQKWASKRGRKRPATIYFLGFTLYCTRNRKGNFRVGLRTEKSRLRRAVLRFQEQMRRMRHSPLREQADHLNQMLRGHYAYYGMASNLRALRKVHRAVEYYWRKMLSSRSWKGTVYWKKFQQIKDRFPLLPPRLHLPYGVLQALATPL